jgi:DNA-binding NarL/FixJ family response regulator
MEALRAGASGYLHKTRGITALTEAISRIQRGEVVVDQPDSARRGRRRCSPRPPAAGGLPSRTACTGWPRS